MFEKLSDYRLSNQAFWGLSDYRTIDYRTIALKGPKHDQIEGEFFYIKQTRMVR
jgi:hypothetical protein